MEHRGQKSAAELSVVRVTASDRPEPPEDLLPCQRSVWRAVASTKPADWFTDDTLPLLRAYVDVDLSARRLAEAMRGYTAEMLSVPESAKAYGDLAKHLRGSASVLGQLAQKMRLSQSARYGARGASGAHERTLKSAKPWET